MYSLSHGYSSLCRLTLESGFLVVFDYLVTWTIADFCTVTEDQILFVYAAFFSLEGILSV